MICGVYSALFSLMTRIIFSVLKKIFDKERIIAFLREKGIALYDTASCVRRLQDNASDKFLEVVSPTDIGLLLQQLPSCRAVVTTGQKATDVFCEQMEAKRASGRRGSMFHFRDRELTLYRMPSSSRAYPLKLEKAAYYRQMFNDLSLL